MNGKTAKLIRKWCFETNQPKGTYDFTKKALVTLGEDDTALLRLRMIVAISDYAVS